MKPPGALDASLIVSELELELRDVGKDKPYLAVVGRGTLAPGLIIPNAWWDRPRIVHSMEVDRPEPTACGLLVIGFRGRCEAEHFAALKALVDGNVRELIEREIVPSVLIKLGMQNWPKQALKPLDPVSRPFGVPVDWEPSPSALVPPQGSSWLAAAIAKAKHLPPPQAPALQPPADPGMLAAPPAIEEARPASRRSRVRIVD